MECLRRLLTTRKNYIVKKNNTCKVKEKLLGFAARDMKKYVFTMTLASLSVAGAQVAAPSWTYSLPDTGLLPSAFSYEFASTMRERHNGDSHFGVHSMSLTVPFSDPYKSFVRGWAVNAELTNTISFVDAEGSLNLREDTLYKFTLPLSLIRKTQKDERYIISLAPTISSDMVSAARCFDLGLFGIYTRKVSDKFSYTAGVAAYPRFARYYVVPFFGFEWKPVDDWTVTLKSFRLSAMHTATKRLSVGPFISSEGGIWTVETARGARMLSVQSLVMGVAGEYDFSKEGQRKRIVTAALGSTLATSVRFHEYGGSREADEAHHYRPGLYASFGVDFRF